MAEPKLEATRPIRILAISGSLRRGSSNTAVLQAARHLVPKGVEVAIFGGLADLPYFNPDLEEEGAPPAVQSFHARLAEADGVLISSPEYARGVPGVMKNALDWLVGSNEIVNKPVALINTSPRATHAQASLMLTLATMSASVIGTASVTLPLLGRNLDEAGILRDADLSTALRSALAAFASAIASRAAKSDR